MVSVVALKDFEHEGEQIHRGQAVWLSVLDAAWRARKGFVTLTKGVRPTYQTRDMVAEPLPVVEIVDPVEVIETPPVAPVESVIPPKRRRGRPRKHPIS